MKLVDLEAQQERIADHLHSRIARVLEHAEYILGPEVEELERELASIAGTKHAVSCSSGTDGLLMALMALDVQAGDLILTTPFTFIATAEVIKLLGAIPVFVDVCQDTLNIDPRNVRPVMERLNAEEQERVKGLVAVDLFGLPSDYASLREALGSGRFIIEDAAQSFGATYRSRPAGSLGDIGVTSFFPAKPLGCYGDGGALFTNDGVLAEKLLSIRAHGKGANKYECIRLGINGRLDTLQAAILLAKLEVFDEEKARREEIAQTYSRAIERNVRVPVVPADCTSAWASYPVLIESHRDELRRNLAASGIPTAIYYPKPVHLQGPYMEEAIPQVPLPVAEAASRKILNLPIHPYLSDRDVERVAGGINDFNPRGREVRWIER